MATYFLLALLYSILTPLWEAPDEPAHFLRVLGLSHRLGLARTAPPPTPWLIPPPAGEGVVGLSRQAAGLLARGAAGSTPQGEAYVRRRRANPLSRLESPGTLWHKASIVRDYESAQPSLHYWPLTPHLYGLDARHLPPFFLNPAYAREFRNLFHHTWDYIPPFRSGTLRVHLLRLTSVLLGLLTALVLIILLREALGADRERLAAGLVMGLLVPQYLFVSAVLNNDPSAIFLCTLALLAALRLLLRPAERPATGLALAVSLILLAALSAKLTASFLLVPLSYAVAAAALRRPSRRERWRLLAAYLGPLALALLLALCRSPRPRGSTLLRLLIPRSLVIREGLLSPDSLLFIARSFYDSYWFRMGWMRLFPPHDGVILFRLLTLLLLLGLLRGVYLASRGRLGVRADLLLFFSLALLALTSLAVKNTLFARQPQARFLFPALGALAFFWGLLLPALAPARLRRWVPWLLFLALLWANGSGLVRAVWAGYEPRASGEPARFLDEGDGGIYLQFDAGFQRLPWKRPVHLLRGAGALRLENRRPGRTRVDLVFPLRGNRPPSGGEAKLVEAWSPEGKLGAQPLTTAWGEFRLLGLELRPGENVLGFLLLQEERQFGALFYPPAVELSAAPPLLPTAD